MNPKPPHIGKPIITPDPFKIFNQTTKSLTRPDFPTYFMDIARAVSARSTCIRRQIGAVITLEDRLINIG